MKILLIAGMLLIFGCESATRPPIPIETVTILQVGDSLRIHFKPNVSYQTAILRMSGPAPSDRRIREIISKRFDGRHSFTVAIADHLTPDKDGRIFAYVGITLCLKLDCPDGSERYTYFSTFERSEK